MSSTSPSPTVVEDVLSAPGEREQGARPPRPADTEERPPEKERRASRREKRGSPVAAAAS